MTVVYHTILQKNTPQGRIERADMTMEEGATLGALLSRLDIRLHLDDLLLVINGRTAGTEYVLSEGDVIDLIPAISGGSR